MSIASRSYREQGRRISTVSQWKFSPADLRNESFATCYQSKEPFSLSPRITPSSNSPHKLWPCYAALLASSVIVRISWSARIFQYPAA